jgi:ketosteroid isomerase-like protein
MSPGDRIQMVRDCYKAYQSEDRELIEGLLADDLVFYSPPDPGIDRAAYFERCWPNARAIEKFEFKRLFEHEGEVFVTYEGEKADGGRFRNTEVFGFDGERISRVEVYFGWNL